ncbi:hypothetical protein ABZ682_10035 [Streptomyces griseoviridis]|uniref:hypothetical protein n=1 Tax=Streptomyces griseoviridis TaxID=45398 RepID=UPI0033C1A260
MELINHHRVLDCGHKPDELFSFQGPDVFTDPENGESCCRRCSDNRHYDRVRRRHVEIEAKAAAEGWAYEYINTSDEVYRRSRELIGKLVCRAYWRHDPHGVDEARGVLQPAHTYKLRLQAARRSSAELTGDRLSVRLRGRQPRPALLRQGVSGHP